jgi:hypothetical protein
MPEKKIKPPRMIRIYICKICRQTGGTLKNIGTHRQPVYIHPICQKKQDETKALLLAMRKARIDAPLL